MPSPHPPAPEGVRDESLHILQHALGLDDYGQGEPYRNHFVAGEDHEDWDRLMAHVEAGRMVRHEPRAIFGGDRSYCFTVTLAGKEYVRERSPKPPQVSRDKARYRRWLRSGCDMTFGEWVRGGYYKREAANAAR